MTGKGHDAKRALESLRDTPPWEWPADTATLILHVLRDDQADETDRLLAAELAGDFTVVNEELVEALLSVLRSGLAPEDLRSTAAIALGPVLEHADTDGFEDGDVPITERMFNTVRDSLREVFADAAVSKEVRRRVLEASVRAPQDWHADAVRAAYHHDDEAWKLTAVFCMRFVRGFDDLILESLESQNPDIHYEAVEAASTWSIDACWPHIVSLIKGKGTTKPLLLAAIGAVAYIRPQDAAEVLAPLTLSDDEDVVEAVNEALVLAQPLEDEDEDEDDEDDGKRH